MTGVPAWLQPVVVALDSITVHHLTRFLPPAGTALRPGAVLMLFGEGADGPDLLLTERAHHMRSHPGQVSFPGGAVDPGEDAVTAALREAWEETGVLADGVEVVGQLPVLWVPPSNFAVTPVVGWWREPSEVTAVHPDEVHAVYRVPISELVDPAHRIAVRHPSGWVGPGFLIGGDKDVILWGFTAGIISRLLEYVGWISAVPDAPVRELPAHMLQGDLGTTDAAGAPGQAEERR